MEGSQILLASLDPERHWYRFHPLLAGYLRQRLEAEHSDEIPKLHRRAYRWYASHQHWTDAVRHALAAGDANEASSWVEQCAMEMVKKGNLLTLLGWQRLFPTELMRSQIRVGLAIAWGLALAMRFDDAVQLIAKVEREVGSVDASDAKEMSCESRAIQAVVAALKDDSESALCDAQPSKGAQRSQSGNVHRIGHGFRGRPG